MALSKAKFSGYPKLGGYLFLIFLFEYFMLQCYRVLTSNYDFHYEFTVRLLVGLSSGLVGGFVTLHLMETWLRKYDLFPEFKVGLHCRSVTVGELGKIKRDIAFSGNVLNTTARIQSRCNAHRVNNLISEDFVSLIATPKFLEKKTIATEVLKGKSRAITLVTYQEKQKY